MELPLITSSSTFTSRQFWKAFLVYHNNLHVVNRKVAGTLPLYFFELKYNKATKLCDIFTYHGLVHETQKLQSVSKECVTPDFIGEMVAPYDKNYSLIPEDISKLLDDKLRGVFISLRILLPRGKNLDSCIEICVCDKENNRASFLGAQKSGQFCVVPPFEYHIEITNTGNIRFILNTLEDCENKSAMWLADILCPKFLKWCEENGEEKTEFKSLSLVQIDTYYALYHNIKDKYCKKMIEVSRKH